jgi:hypothetical protein
VKAKSEVKKTINDELLQRSEEKALNEKVEMKRM